MLDYIDFGLLRIRLFACALLIFYVQIGASNAQTFELVPNDSIMGSVWLEDNVDLTIEQKNITQDTLHLVWALVDALVPAQWDASVCDNVFCYTSLVDSGAMSPVSPGNRGKLYIRFTPHVIAGKGVVRYAVWDRSLPNRIDTLTYILSAQSTTDVTRDIDGSFFCMMNHARQVVDIRAPWQADFSTELYNGAGELVATSTGNQSNAQVHVHEHPVGWYFLRVVCQNRTFNYHFLKD